MSGIAGEGCERIIPTEEKKSLEEIERSIVKGIESQYGLSFVRL